MVSTTSRSLPVGDPIFKLPTRTLLDSASLLTLHICRVKCENSCLFFTTPLRRCSASLRIRRSDPCPLNTVFRSRYGAPSRGWRLSPCLFNTIFRFWYAASLRGLHPNNFLCDFIYIEMTKIVIDSSNLIHPLFYSGLGSTMLDNMLKMLQFARFLSSGRAFGVQLFFQLQYFWLMVGAHDCMIFFSLLKLRRMVLSTKVRQIKKLWFRWYNHLWPACQRFGCFPEGFPSAPYPKQLTGSYQLVTAVKQVQNNDWNPLS
jgi:hypothetical protein